MRNPHAAVRLPLSGEAINDIPKTTTKTAHCIFVWFLSFFLQYITHDKESWTGSVPSCFLEVFSVNNLSALVSSA